MPWKMSQCDKTEVRNGDRIYQIPDFNFRKTKRQWKEHFESICKDKHFKDIDMEGSVKLNDDGNIKAGSKLIIRQRAGNLKICNAAVQLYLFYQCRLTEADFNAPHALLNKLLYDTEVSMIICDREEPHGIELSDILIWKDNTTYLVHVKSGFTGSAIREVCSDTKLGRSHMLGTIFNERNRNDSGTLENPHIGCSEWVSPKGCKA